MSFKNILISLDFSESAQSALIVGTRLAKSLGAEIHLAHVLRFPLPVSVAGPITSIAEVEREVRKQGDEKLEEAGEWVESQGVTVETHLLEGQISPSLVKLAQDLEVDLIVLGRRGLNRIAEVMLGSVADHTVRLAPCPVMIVKAEDT